MVADETAHAVPEPEAEFSYMGDYFAVGTQTDLGPAGWALQTVQDALLSLVLHCGNDES